MRVVSVQQRALNLRGDSPLIAAAATTATAAAVTAAIRGTAIAGAGAGIAKAVGAAVET